MLQAADSFEIPAAPLSRGKFRAEDKTFPQAG